MDDAAERGRLVWRCRRGMKELDLLLREYLDQHWPVATTADREAFAQLLELPDPDLASYLLGHAIADDISLEPVLAVLRGLSARRAGAGSPGATAVGRGPGPLEPESDLS